MVGDVKLMLMSGSEDCIRFLCDFVSSCCWWVFRRVLRGGGGGWRCETDDVGVRGLYTIFV